MRKLAVSGGMLLLFSSLALAQGRPRRFRI